MVTVDARTSESVSKSSPVRFMRFSESDSEMEMDPDSNLTPTPMIDFFVIGRAKWSQNWVIVRFEAIQKGWLSEVICGEAPDMKNIYMSNETREELATWFPCDFMNRAFMADSLEEAKEYLARKADVPLYSS